MMAFGTYRGSLKECTVTEAVEKWLQLGGRHIDTAFNYGTQPDVGAALKHTAVSRHDIFVTTKIPGPIGKGNVTNLIMNTSLPQLGVDYIDLVLITILVPMTPMSSLTNAAGWSGARSVLAL